MCGSGHAHRVVGAAFVAHAGPRRVALGVARPVNATGLEVLLAQGVAQFRLWTGVRPPVAAMAQALERGAQALEAEPRG